MDSAIENLLDTVVDGRAEGIRFRQDNLLSLHNELRKESSALTAAQEKDTGASKAEIEAEHFLALEAVRHFYESLDFAKELETEYLVAHGKDNANRRTGAGLVIIRPTTYTRLFSILSPLAAALAAGSVVALELEDSLSQLDTVLRDVLPRALNQNAFCITKTITDAYLLEQAILVDQTNKSPLPAARANNIVSANAARAVAIVDRTADVEAAAKAITAARFSFGGQSPYAPDLVLVNEFVKKDFFEACSKHATLAFARETTVRRTSDNSSDETRRTIQEAEDKRLVSSFGSKDFKLVDVKDKCVEPQTSGTVLFVYLVLDADNSRSASLLNIKISGRFLPIATSSGLVDSIYTQEFENPLLAAYFFAGPEEAKYLAQHLPAHISFVNQIPSNLLLGPAAPISHEPAFAFCYSKDMFSVARPQFIERPTGALAKVEQLLTGSGSGSGAVTAQSLHALALTPLQPTKQPGNSSLGFFERGVLLSASLVMSVLLPSLAYGTWIGGRRVFDYALKLRG
ncbi:Aldehyde/histidinol dehydrogenase [Colletotrichum cereale]|nr:Aldehyde/histidinol dehydrogenase [Colletotrichum cereale]